MRGRCSSNLRRVGCRVLKKPAATAASGGSWGSGDRQSQPVSNSRCTDIERARFHRSPGQVPNRGVQDSSGHGCASISESRVAQCLRAEQSSRGRGTGRTQGPRTSPVSAGPHIEAPLGSRNRGAPVGVVLPNSRKDSGMFRADTVPSSATGQCVRFPHRPADLRVAMHRVGTFPRSVGRSRY